jgi:hypothetical protein
MLFHKSCAAATIPIDNRNYDRLVIGKLHYLREIHLDESTFAFDEGGGLDQSRHSKYQSEFLDWTQPAQLCFYPTGKLITRLYGRFIILWVAIVTLASLILSAQRLKISFGVYCLAQTTLI